MLNKQIHKASNLQIPNQWTALQTERLVKRKSTNQAISALRHTYKAKCTPFMYMTRYLSIQQDTK
jgi:hypothetical protein